MPFLFQEPPPQSPFNHAWVPPPHFSPEKAFPQPEIKDVEMIEQSPPKTSRYSPEKENTNDHDSDRPLALGAMRRVYNSRRRARERNQVRRPNSGHDDAEDSDDDSDDEGKLTPITQNTSNHYTLNLPGPAAAQSDLPYILLGYVFPEACDGMLTIANLDTYNSFLTCPLSCFSCICLFSSSSLFSGM